MKQRSKDLAGILSVGLLLTVILVVWFLIAQRSLEYSALFSPPTRWWNVYIFTDTILLGACPILFAFFSARRTAFNPFLSGITTCLIPAFFCFALRYGMNVVEKLEMERSPHLGWALGYVDPTHLWGNLVLAAPPAAWALVVGTCGGALALAFSRRKMMKEASYQRFLANPGPALRKLKPGS